jgi:hypothetical protein
MQVHLGRRVMRELVLGRQRLEPFRNSARHQAFIHAALAAVDAIRRGDAQWRPGRGGDRLVAELGGTVPVTPAR